MEEKHREYLRCLHAFAENSRTYAAENTDKGDFGLAAYNTGAAEAYDRAISLISGTASGLTGDTFEAAQRWAAGRTA